jgi:hypothetical protein
MRKLYRTHNRQYMNHKKNAKIRGIPWEFTYDTWYDIWITSGHLEHRGRRAGEYCMSRFNDTGPYSPTNVFIQLITQNTTQGRVGKKHTTEAKQLMSKNRRGISPPSA